MCCCLCLYRRRVYLAAKVLSRTMHRVLKEEIAAGNATFKSRNFPGADSYDSLLELIKMVDRLTDVCNTAASTCHPEDPSSKPFQPVSTPDDVQIGFLFETLEYVVLLR